MNLVEWLAAILVLLAVAGATLVWWFGRRQPVRGRRSAGPATRPWVPHRHDAAERARQDIDARVEDLRRARERAERWVPPAVDAVASRPPPHHAADNTLADSPLPDDEAPPRPRAG